MGLESCAGVVYHPHMRARALDKRVERSQREVEREMGVKAWKRDSRCCSPGGRVTVVCTASHEALDVKALAWRGW